MPRRWIRWLMLLGAAAALAAPAYANAGTAMMWLIPGHLLIGNLIIGALEYSLLTWLLRKSRDADAGYNPWGPFTLVFANYASAWAGVWLVATGWRGAISAIFDEPLYSTGAVIALGWLMLFLLSVLVEWPFVMWASECITRQRRSWLSSLRRSLALNVTSYIPLTILYALVSPITLPTQVTVDPSLSFARGVAARLYYVTDTGQVVSVRPDGTERQEIDAPLLKSKRPQLVLVKNPETTALDLYGRAKDESRGFVSIARSVGKVPVFPDAPSEGSRHPARPRYEEATSNARATDLRTPRLTGTEVIVGFWSANGVTWRNASNYNRARLLHLAVETPFLALTAKGGTVVGDNLLIFHYENAFDSRYRRVVALHLPSRRFAVLAAGSSPVVVLDELPEGAQWWKSPYKEPLRSSFLKFQVEKDKP